MSNKILATYSGSEQVNLLLNTILERCTKEKDQNCLQVPLEDCYERVSYYTAYPKTYIYEISDAQTLKEAEANLILDRVVILQCVKSLLEKSKLPTLPNLFEAFFKYQSKNKVKCSLDVTLFLAQISNLGYEYRKSISGPLVIIENPKITFDRFNYLKRIKTSRAKGDKTFYYIDQRVVDTDWDFKKPLLSCASQVLKRGYYYSVMLSSKSYEHGLFTTQASEEGLIKWVRDILLPMMKPSSIVVLDHNQFCGSPMNYITRYHTKKQMLEWLKENDIPYDTLMSKAELYDLFDKCSIKDKGCRIERLLKAYGHEVLFLPPVKNLSPTHFLWTHIMTHITNTDSDLHCTRNNILQFVTNITHSLWASFEGSVIELERKLFEIDLDIERYLDDVCQLDKKCDIESHCICHTFQLYYMDETNTTNN